MLTTKLLIYLFVISCLSCSNEKHHKIELNDAYYRVLGTIEFDYLDAEKLELKKMVNGALDAIQKAIPEVTISQTPLSVQVNTLKNSKKFEVCNLSTISEFNDFIEEIINYIVPNLIKKQNFIEIDYLIINGILSSLDPYSVFFEPAVADAARADMQGEFGGIGVKLELSGDIPLVSAVLMNSPAVFAGIKPYDQIIEIDGVSTLNLSMEEISQRLRGKPGTIVSVMILRHNQKNSRLFSIVRDVVQKNPLIGHLVGNIGYIQISTFSENTANDLGYLINSFGSIEGLILDFRNNLGGFLNEAVSLADLFLNGGLIVITKGGNNQWYFKEKASWNKKKTKLPMVLLVNSHSASASEVVAGALQDRARGVIVGEQTFGKATVQRMQGFEDYSALKLTFAQYLTPNSKSIQGVGILPDIFLRPVFFHNNNVYELLPKESLHNTDKKLYSQQLNKADNFGRLNIFTGYQIPYFANKLVPGDFDDYSLFQVKYDFQIRFSRILLETYARIKRRNMKFDSDSCVNVIKFYEIKDIRNQLSMIGVDWKLLNSRLISSKFLVEVFHPTNIIAGDTIELKFKITNIDSSPAYQVFLTFDSNNLNFSSNQIAIGSIRARETAVLDISLKSPTALLARKEIIAFSIASNGGNQSRIVSKISIDIYPAPKPVLLFNYKKLPNALYIRLKNVGKAIAKRPAILIKNKKEFDLFIQGKDEQIKSLNPGDSVEILLPDEFINKNSKNTELQIQVLDLEAGEQWTDHLKISNDLTLKHPAKIILDKIFDAPVISKFAVFNFSTVIKSDFWIQDIIILVNDRKVFYKSLDGKKQRNIILNQNIDLKKGINKIEIIVRSNDLYLQRESVTVYYQHKNPFTKS